MAFRLFSIYPFYYYLVFCCCCCCFSKRIRLFIYFVLFYQTCFLKRLRMTSPRAHLHVVGIFPHIFFSFFFFCSCAYFCFYGPFNCISFHKFFRQLSVFSLCPSGLTSASLILSTTDLLMKVSFSPDIIPSGLLDSKYQ